MDIETCPVVRFHAETYLHPDDWPDGVAPEPEAETWEGYADPDDADDPSEYHLVVADAIVSETGWVGEPSVWPLPDPADCDRVWWTGEGDHCEHTGEYRRVSAHRGEGIPVETWGRALRHLAVRQCPRALR